RAALGAGARRGGRADPRRPPHRHPRCRPHHVSDPRRRLQRRAAHVHGRALKQTFHSSCPAKAGHPVNTHVAAIFDTAMFTGSPAFAGDDEIGVLILIAPPLRYFCEHGLAAEHSSPMTAMPWISISMPGRAKLETVISALPG